MHLGQVSTRTNSKNILNSKIIVSIIYNTWILRFQFFTNNWSPQEEFSHTGYEHYSFAYSITEFAVARPVYVVVWKCLRQHTILASACSLPSKNYKNISMKISPNVSRMHCKLVKGTFRLAQILLCGQSCHTLCLTRMTWGKYQLCGD